MCRKRVAENGVENNGCRGRSQTSGFGVLSGERMKDFKQRHNLLKLSFKEVTPGTEGGLKELGVKSGCPF